MLSDVGFSPRARSGSAHEAAHVGPLEFMRQIHKQAGTVATVLWTDFGISCPQPGPKPKPADTELV